MLNFLSSLPSSQSPNADDPGDDALYPLAVGGNEILSEIFLGGGQWTAYKELPSDDWSSLGCFNGNNDLLYHIGENVTVVNLNNWEVYDIDAAPAAMQFPLTCSLMVDPEPNQIIQRFGTAGPRSRGAGPLALDSHFSKQNHRS